MSMEMQMFYHVINSSVTVFYYLCQMLIISNIVDHKKHIVKTMIAYSCVYLSVVFMTETAVPVLVKTYVHMAYLVIMYRIFFSEKTAAVAMHVVYFWFICVFVQENIIIFFCKLNHIVPWVDVGHGVQLGKAQVILISSFFMLILTLLLKHILKPFVEVMEHRDLWFLVLAGLFFQGLCEALQKTFYRHEEGGYLIIGIVLHMGIAIIAILLCVFVYKFLYVDKKEREERIQREILERQYVYYQEKQKEEEKVRSIYHDMKNHLLVLEHQIHSPETADMVEKLQWEVESYADYVQTGNDFLDVIIKDKAQTAREKQIDFSAAIDLYGIDFLEPLDISTLFGNGIDNAIEASEKLPEDRRVIQVKAGRVQDFLSILMENNCLEEGVREENRMCSGENVPRKESAYSAEMEQRKGSAQSVEMAPRKESAQSVEMAQKKESGQGVEMVPRKGGTQSADMVQGKSETQSTEIAERIRYTHKKKTTSKKDDYFHGFGISNMKQAAEKYGGQLTENCENGRFTVKILIPMP